MFQLIFIVFFLQTLNLFIRLLDRFSFNTTLLKTYIRGTQLKFIFSNHDQRLIAILNSIKRFDFRLLRQFSEQKQKHNNPIKTFVFIGDSHVERYSRTWSHESISVNKFLQLGYWLGPWTLISFLTKDRNIKFIETLENVLNSSANQQIFLILSFGSIDVRTVYFELYLRGIVKDDKDFLELIDRAFNQLILLLNNLKDKYPNICGIGFLELINSTIDGQTPTTVKSISLARKKEEFATFGDIALRAKLTDNINLELKKLCSENNIKWLPTKSLFTKKNLPKLLNDGIHVEKAQYISRINESIKNVFK